MCEYSFSFCLFLGDIPYSETLHDFEENGIVNVV